MATSNNVEEVALAVDNYPLWQYVTKQGKTSDGGGNQTFKCNFCKVSYRGSYPRVKSHLLKITGGGIKVCPKITVGQVSEMAKLDDEAIRRRDNSKPKMVPLPSSTPDSTMPSTYSNYVDALNPTSFRQESYGHKKRKAVSDIEKAFNLQNREHLDGEIARMFYSGAIPFNFARNPYFISAFCFAVNANIRGYVPPCYNANIRVVLEDRWSKSNNHLHCLAHSLNPQCTTREWQNEHPNLSSPQNDPQISRMRKICLKRLFPSEDIRKKVNLELANFFGCLDDFAYEDYIRDRSVMQPLRWWLVYGSAAPNLQPTCMKLFRQVCSSSCCERNWSTYSFIHSTKRNQITPQRVEDLMFVHSNLSLLSRKTPQYMQEDTKMWDVAGDAFESLDEVGILQIANLSLHELELESDLFVDDVNEENQDV